MTILSLAMMDGEYVGAPIPNPYPGLRSLGAHIRRGQVSMALGPPGAGKTAFVTDWILRAKGLGLEGTVLNFSADSDSGTVGVRTLAAVTGYQMQECEKHLKGPYRQQMLDKLDAATSHISYVFIEELTQKVIQGNVHAVAEQRGAWPSVIVVDNLIDVTSDEDQLHEGYNASIKSLKILAGETGAAVVILHHTTGEFESWTDPLPLRAALGKTNRFPRLVLGVTKPEDNLICVSVPKNSNGPANAKGDVNTFIKVDLSRMAFMC